MEDHATANKILQIFLYLSLSTSSQLPIVGLAIGSLKTPSSRCSKKRMMIPSTESKKTPGSGESLLRGQVKTLLQKVEEEGVISKICFEPNSLIRKRFVNYPLAVLAPTSANTPQVYDFSISNNKGIILPS